MHPTEAMALLATIPNHGFYAEWYMIARALRRRYDDRTARRLWDFWSAKSDRYDPRAQERDWRRITHYSAAPEYTWHANTSGGTRRTSYGQPHVNRRRAHYATCARCLA
jgi:Primase C terminal 2 (PriCT-2)